MIVKCPGCSGALEYDVATDKMICKYCGNSYFVGELQTNEQKNEMVNRQNMYVNQNPNEQTNMSEACNPDDMMECNMYSCTACGASLMINNVETSTFCAYCGQPTIVFDRVSMQKRPKYIIPFTVSKEKAVSLIRDKMNAGSFIPDEIKNFKIDVVRGIYVPFWVFDMDYEDDILVKGKVKQNKNTVTRYFYRSAGTRFMNMPIDASKRFNDFSSKRLEPYYLTEAKPFNPQYFSGYYADCSDEETRSVQGKAGLRARAMFEEAIISTVNASNKKILNQCPRYNIIRMEYAMFPAWFLVFKYQGKSYTMMVNGQTGKVVGAVPYVKRRVLGFFGALAGMISFLLIPIINGLFSIAAGDSFGNLIMFFAVLIGILFTGASKKYKSYLRSQELTTEATFTSFVKDRQEG